MLIILSILSLIITAFLLATLFQAFTFQSFSLVERVRFNKFNKRLAKLEEFGSASTVDQKVRIINDSLCLDIKPNDAQLVEQIHNHHQRLIKALSAYTGHGREHAPFIEVLEDLLLTRTALLRSYCDALKSTKAIRNKRKHPEWAVEEYRKKEVELEEKLNINRQSIHSQAERFVRTLTSGESGSDIVVH